MKQIIYIDKKFGITKKKSIMYKNMNVLDIFPKGLLSIFEENQAKRIFIVRGKQSYTDCGARDKIEYLIKSINVSVAEYYNFSNNPKREDIEKGVKFFESFKPNMMIAIGGGSIIDMAKLIRYYSVKEFENVKRIPLIAIPTTAGTGAESTHFSVCYIDNIKHSIEHEIMLPDIVLLYPEFTYHNDAYLTACTGFDAFAQAVEAYWNINATEESDQYAFTAIKLLYHSLKEVICKKREIEKNRINLLLGANMSGQAINITRTTAPHALSYTLTSKYLYPHGHAVALTFPFFFQENLKCSEAQFKGYDYAKYHSKMEQLLKLLQLDVNVDLFSFMKNYITEIGLVVDNQRPINEEVVSASINLDRAKNNPCQLTSEIIRQAVESINKIQYGK